MVEAPYTGHPRRWAILGVLVLSLLVVVLDNTVLNVALRTIADPVHGLGATQSQLEWAINSYTLVFAGLLFTFGVLADRWGRRNVLIAGMLLFGIASFISAYAQDPGQLIAARAFMGVGGAAVMPATLSIISNVFDPRERGKAIGVWAGAVGLAVAIGPVVGGALLERFWWGSVFLINVPIVIIAVVAIVAMVPESRDPQPGRIDVAGVLMSIVGLVALVYGIIDGGEHGFGRVQAWAPIAIGLAVLGLFIWYERRIEFPSLDVRLFRNPAFSAAVAAVGLVFFAAMGMMFFFAFYLQLVRGLSPLESGLMFIPFAVAQVVFAPQSAGLVKRFGPKAVCAVGLSLVAVAIGGFLFLDETSPLWVFGLLSFIQGAGMANVIPPVTESVMSALPREKAGIGSAVNNTVRQVGGALGIAVVGSMLASSYRSSIADSVAGLPAGVQKTASESISGSYGVADRLGPAGAGLIADANSAFVQAMHVAVLGSVFVALVGVAVVLAWMPRRSGPLNGESPARPTKELAEVGVGSQ
jgi:EmrB/QacA subfamily drug resistance transporter